MPITRSPVTVARASVWSHLGQVHRLKGPPPMLAARLGGFRFMHENKIIYRDRCSLARSLLPLAPGTHTFHYRTPQNRHVLPGRYEMQETRRTNQSKKKGNNNKKKNREQKKPKVIFPFLCVSLRLSLSLVGVFFNILQTRTQTVTHTYTR